MNPYVNTQSEPMGTDGQTNKWTNGRTDKYLLIYSGISSHSLRGVRKNLQDYGFVRISTTHLFSNWQSKKQFRNLPIRIFQASCWKMIQTMKKISLLGLCFHTKRAHCWHPSIFTALLFSILICRRTQLWHASLHHGIRLCQICRINYLSLCNWYNIVICHRFPPSSPITLLEKIFA